VTEQLTVDERCSAFYPSSLCKTFVEASINSGSESQLKVFYSSFDLSKPYHLDLYFCIVSDRECLLTSINV